MCGGWAAFFGWIFGEWLSPRDDAIKVAGVKGMFVGLTIALGLSLVDALWNLSARQFLLITQRVGVALLVGSVGGLIGGLSGTGAVYVSGGAEHQGPPGGGPVAAIARLFEE